MSTVSKLNPKIREARTERRNFRRFLHSTADLSTDVGRIIANTLERVDRIRNDSHCGPESKSERFDAALRYYAEKRRELEPA